METPGCLTIPYSVGSFKFKKALCDLGASLSVMPRYVFEKLCLPELEPMTVCLELGDNSIHYPLGIAVDVPVKVGHRFIPVDFMVLEMGEREKPSLILGRPFLKTVGATIDIRKGEIKFDINSERSSFKFRPWFEVCNMIKVTYILPHCCISKEEPRKKEEPEKKKAKKIKKVVASVKIKEQKPPVKTKKMTKPEKKPAPKMVWKWVPKIETPTKSVDPK
jgi:predicted aspartyl protease